MYISNLYFSLSDAQTYISFLSLKQTQAQKNLRQGQVPAVDGVAGRPPQVRQPQGHGEEAPHQQGGRQDLEAGGYAR